MTKSEKRADEVVRQLVKKCKRLHEHIDYLTAHLDFRNNYSDLLTVMNILSKTTAEVFERGLDSPEGCFKYSVS